MAKLVGYACAQQGSSLLQQRQAIQKHCKLLGHTLVGYYEDVESSSSVFEREQLLWALKTVASGADGLICYELNRLVQCVEEGEVLKKALKKSRKLLVVVSRAVDLSSDDGSFMYTVNTAISEIERKRMQQRCETGRRNKQKAGGWIGGAPPFGYTSFRGQLVEVPHEQNVIDAVRVMRQEGSTYKEIAQHLNACNVRTKRGSQQGWSVMGVKRIIEGPPEVILKMQEGQILPANFWEMTFGKTKSQIKKSRTKWNNSTTG